MSRSKGIQYVRIPVGLLGLNIRSAYELVALAWAVAFGNDGLFLTHGQLARILHINRRSAVRVVQRLQANGHVNVSRRDGRRFIKASDDILSLVGGDKLSPEVVTGKSLALVTGKSPPSKQNIETLTLKEGAHALSAKSNAPRQRFKPPTEAEVAAYATEQGRPDFDAAWFVQYYTTAGWLKQNGKPVNNWRLTVLTWLRRDEKNNPQPEPGTREATNEEADHHAKMMGWA